MGIGVAGDFVAVVQMRMLCIIDMANLFSSLKIPRGGMGQETGVEIKGSLQPVPIQ